MLEKINCSNCGWVNPAKLLACERCGQVLLANNNQISKGKSPYDKTVLGWRHDPELDNHSSPPPKIEIEKREDPVFKEKTNAQVSNDDQSLICGYCDYPIGRGVEECPKCGEKLNKRVIDEVVSQVHPAPIPQTDELSPKSSEVDTIENPTKVNCTFDPYTYTTKKSHALSLIPIRRQDEKVPIHSVPSFGSDPYDSVPIILNRSLLDPENRTISSSEQAELHFVEGKWVIIDKSHLKTTFVLISQPHILTHGDILLMGDRKFQVAITESEQDI